LSNRQLTEATAEDHFGPIFHPRLDFIQERYKTRAYNRRPIDEKFLEHFAIQLTTLFNNVKFSPVFKTQDGTEWYSIRVMYMNGTVFRFLFPRCNDKKHHDGTVSDQHIALYIYGDDLPEEKHLNNVTKAFLGWFEQELIHFYTGVLH